MGREALHIEACVRECGEGWVRGCVLYATCDKHVGARCVGVCNRSSMKCAIMLLVLQSWYLSQ